MFRLPTTLLPKTLFWRNLLLIIALILISQLSSAWLFRELVMKPRVRLTAEATAQDLLALVDGLQALAPADRARFVERFNAHTHEQLRQRDDVGLPAAAGSNERLAPLEQTFVREVSARLAPHQHSLVWRRMGGDLLAVRVMIDDHSYWVELPALRPGHEFSSAWVMGSAATGLFAVLGAWWMQRRINRPLNDLVQAAGALGRGERPQPLAEHGPAEIATVAHSFNDMVANLARSEQERHLMLAGLSHDLRTPLAKMRLVAEMLPTDTDPQLVDSLKRNIESVDALLGQFLDFIRANDRASWDQEPLAPGDLNEVIRQALRGCRFDPEGHHTHLAAEALNLPLRRQAVARVVTNLVVNAERHGAPPVEVASGRNAHSVWLEVRDRGPGIAPGQAQRLKQPFERGDSARGGPSGAGLGLAIVDRIARAHGASFDLLPREGGGLIARVAWPLDTPQGPSALPQHPA
jgi:two-component system osmolarity sensor histidine kinase EnvZ